MTSTENALDPVAEMFASLDAMPTPAAPAPLPIQPSQTLEQAQETAALAHALRPRKVARLALAGITNGQPRVEMKRPKYGKQTTTALLATSQGTLDAEALAVDGRSRRYRQDLEGWARAAMADHAQRGVLVTWDGMFYTIALDADAPAMTVVEVHRRDLAAWRVAQSR